MRLRVRAIREPSGPPLLLLLVLSMGCLDARRAGPPARAAVSGVAALAGDSRVPAVRIPGRSPDQPPSSGRVQASPAGSPKSVVDLQPFREVTRLTIEGIENSPALVSLTDLNPRIRAWYLLELTTSDGRRSTYHLENPSGARLRLDPILESGIVLERAGSASGENLFCELWPPGGATPLADARKLWVAYAPLCGGLLFLRNPVEGRRTSKERVVDLLRDHVWQGEEITSLVKDWFFEDAYLATSTLAGAGAGAPPPAEPPAGPLPPLVSAAALDRLLVPANLELGLTGRAGERVAVGHWYPVDDNPGIFVTTLRPDLVSPEVIAEQRGRVAILDPVEAEALVYLVAFDLQQLDLGFRLGTDHPRVGWSDMALPAMRDDGLAGPDGIETVAPLVRTGMLSPAEQTRVVATFTGGFKRAHGAFRTSDLATTRHGSHYGFVENGVVLSKLQPGLATVLVFDDGTVDLKTWADRDDADLPRIRHARQNGVPILERDPASLRAVPGSRVRQWSAGNWSGSADRKLRTLRAGLCLQESAGKEFLLYGYFSSATPSSMARVFQAAGCRYAMLLDMNALEHTYMAVYRQQDSQLLPQHLIEGMGDVDGSRDGQVLPRFVSVADNRDFFYLLRRTPR